MADISEFHRSCFVVDAHCDTLLDITKGVRNLGESGKGGHIDIPRLRQGGVGLQVFDVWVEPSYRPGWATLRAIEMIDAFYQQLARYPFEIAFVTSGREIDQARQTGRIAAMLWIEGGEPLGGSLAGLRTFYRLGVRGLSLTWNHRNELADGVEESGTRGGLTAFGRDVVRLMNELGMVVDVSHLSDAGFWEVMELSTTPVVASHSNAKTLCGHVRNLTDSQLQALARKGGVTGINFLPRFLVDGGEGVTLDDVVRHIDYIADQIGTSYIGLGSDFDGISRVPAGLEDVSCLPNLTMALIDRGYAESDVRKILGENFLRVFHQVLKEN